MNAYLDNGSTMLDHGEHELDNLLRNADGLRVQELPGVDISVFLHRFLHLLHGDVRSVLPEHDERACDEWLTQLDNQHDSGTGLTVGLGRLGTASPAHDVGASDTGHSGLGIGRILISSEYDY